MKKRTIFYSALFAMVLAFIVGFNMEVKASFLDVLDTVNSTARTITNVNRAGKSTMSTIESAQRFTDRQQDRKDLKRAEKEYNESAEAEYYRTLQETQQLKQQYYGNL